MSFVYLGLGYLLIVLIILLLILTVAFYTIAERKIMGSVQRRQGPNVVGFLGLLQAIADALKLALKEPIIPYKSNLYLFLLAPALTFTCALIQWLLFIPTRSVEIAGIVPNFFSSIDFVTLVANRFINPWFLYFSTNEYSYTVLNTLLGILTVSSLSVYGIILAGWSSNSRYSFLGALRSTSQMVAYEVLIGLMLIPVIIFIGPSFSINLVEYFQSNLGCWAFLPFMPLSCVFLVAMLAETNRAPFDLPEAEAEIVAGYNVEYGSLHFAMFFLGEYINMLTMCFLFSQLFLGGWTILKFLIIAVFFVLIRATLPRYRYDQLQLVGWQFLLPVVLGFFLFFVAYVFLNVSY